MSPLGQNERNGWYLNYSGKRKEIFLSLPWRWAPDGDRHCKSSSSTRLIECDPFKFSIPVAILSSIVKMLTGVAKTWVQYNVCVLLRSVETFRHELTPFTNNLEHWYRIERRNLKSRYGSECNCRQMPGKTIIKNISHFRVLIYVWLLFTGNPGRPSGPSILKIYYNISEFRLSKDEFLLRMKRESNGREAAVLAW